MESKVKRKRLFLLILVLAGASHNDISPFISSSVDTDIRKSKVPGT